MPLLRVTVLEGVDLAAWPRKKRGGGGRGGGPADRVSPYLVVSLGGREEQTPCGMSVARWAWDQAFDFDLPPGSLPAGSSLTVTCLDRERMAVKAGKAGRAGKAETGAAFLGCVSIPVGRLPREGSVQQWYQLGQRPRPLPSSKGASKRGGASGGGGPGGPRGERTGTGGGSGGSGDGGDGNGRDERDGDGATGQKGDVAADNDEDTSMSMPSSYAKQGKETGGSLLLRIERIDSIGAAAVADASSAEAENVCAPGLGTIDVDIDLVDDAAGAASSSTGVTGGSSGGGAAADLLHTGTAGVGGAGGDYTDADTTAISPGGGGGDGVSKSPAVTSDVASLETTENVATEEKTTTVESLFEVVLDEIGPQGLGLRIQRLGTDGAVLVRGFHRDGTCGCRYDGCVDCVGCVCRHVVSTMNSKCALPPLYYASFA